MTRYEALAVVVVFVLVVTLAWIWSRYWLDKRRNRQLQYKAVDGVRSFTDVMRETSEVIKYGSSVAEWRRRSAASLQASRQRRGLR